MAGTIASRDRARRTARIKRRATAASLAVLLGAVVLVGASTSLPPGEPAAAGPTAGGASLAAANRPLNQRTSATPAPRRIKTRQS